MEGRLSTMAVYMVMVVAVVQLRYSNAQTTHVVGDALGWTIPLDDPLTYATWASRQTFIVGDVLVFNFVGFDHDVAEVSQEGYDQCLRVKPMFAAEDSPARITLTTAGRHYYISRYTDDDYYHHWGGACSNGQKLAINVYPATTPPLSANSSPSSGGSATTPLHVPSSSPSFNGAPVPVAPLRLFSFTS